MATFKSLLPPVSPSVPRLEEGFFVGIDQSFTGTGVVLLDNGGQYVDHTLISTEPSNTPMGSVDRIIGIFHSLYDWIKDHTDGKMVGVVLEDFAYSQSNKMADLGGLGWHIRIMLSRTAYLFASCAPGTLKKFVASKGNASKSAMILNVYKRWGFETENDNLADAFGLAKLSWMLYGRPDAGTKGVRTSDFSCVEKLKVYR